MIKSKDSLKAKVNNLAKEINIPNKYIIQEFMFEALLRRISISKYKEQFVIKGGLLLASIFGVNLRSTMDLDTTIKRMSLTKTNLETIMKEIMAIDIHDNIKFELENIKNIRFDDEYFGYNVNLKVDFDGLKTNLMIDFTTGDIITYSEMEYQYKTLFDNDIISIISYNFETIIAEKFESILSRNIENTRMKDYYDLYMFVNLKWNDIDKKELWEAIQNTSRKRKTENYILNATKYIELIENDSTLKQLWSSYTSNYEYAKEINFKDTIEAIRVISQVIGIIEV